MNTLIHCGQTMAIECTCVYYIERVKCVCICGFAVVPYWSGIERLNYADDITILTRGVFD